MNNLKIKLIAIFSLLILSLSVSSVVAQDPYGSYTSNILISSDGAFSVTDGSGVTYDIQGTPGASGTVKTVIYNGNPQPGASIPAGISLTYFVLVTFNMDPADFTQAKITIPYTNSEVQGAEPPYSIFKYDPATDSFTELAAVLDTNAKTITITVTSIDDPLFAIGGASSDSDDGGFSSLAWVALAASVVIIVVLMVVGVWYFRKHS